MKNYIPIGLFLISIFLSVLLLKEYFYVASPDCSSYSNCKDCSVASNCAWCLNIGKCVKVNRMGFPEKNECQDNDIASFPSHCNKPATSDLPFETISGNTAVDPQTGKPYTTGGGSGDSSSGSSGSSGSGSGSSGSGSSGSSSWSQLVNNSGMTANNWLKNSGWDSNNGWGQKDVSGNPISSSKLIKDVGYQYAGACPDYNLVETRIKTNLDPTIKNILKSELTRSGLTYVEGFGQLETTQMTIQAGIKDDITSSVRKAICKKTKTKSWIGKPDCT